MKKQRYVGERNGRLVLVQKIGPKLWLAQCDCGNSHELDAGTFNTKSCGCLKREMMREVASLRFKTHGWKGKPEHYTWAAMISRCTNPSHPAFKNYGGRGISVCDEWRRDFSAFIEHIGPRPSNDHSLDRIDNERGYEPGNVRWATRGEQAKNRRERARNSLGQYR